MATVDVTAPQPRSALDEPTGKVGGSWITKYTLGFFAIAAPTFAAYQVLLPRQAEAVAGDGKETALAVVTAVAAAVSIVAGILAGAASDRTLAKRGRRQVWVLGGGVVASAALLLQGLQTSLLGMVLLFAVVTIGTSASGAALYAAMADEVPVSQRATTSACWGIAYAAGPLVGIALVTLVVTGVFSGFAAMAVLCLALSLPYALTTRGARLLPAERAPFSLSVLVSGIVAPLKHADFAWAWTGRFFLQLSNALAQVYLWFFLKDRVDVEPDTWTLILSAAYTVAVIAATIPAGRISDRTGKRKRMVVISCVLQGVAALFLAFLPVLPAVVAGAVLLGVGYGIYAAVDQALITQVLPRAEDRGKDLGVINIANVLPYVVAPATAGVIIGVFGREDLGYPVLFVLSAVTAVIAALTVQPIKSVR